MNKNINIEYYQLAQIQTDKAIELYLTDTIEGYICSITLAGAAEEIAGKLIERDNRRSAYQFLIQNLSNKFTEYNEATIRQTSNFIRNGLKHFTEELCEDEIELELHARVMIMRAVANYCTLNNKRTDLMTRFMDIYIERTEE